MTTTCRVRFGNTSYSYSNSATVTLTAGSGTAYIYIASDGTLTVGHNLTLQCVNCVAQAGVTAFPPGSVPLANWTASNAAWVAGSDQRAFQSGKVVAAGVGLAGAESAGTTTLSLDTTLVGMRVSPPATAGDNCVAGSWATDTTFYYTCVSENTWRRAALGVW
ncbi:MAG: hypothetical protein IT167_18290 [Bryobacterales bacterium]|nr:hypothetical protein [Bryobacterales bacterium]